MRQASDIAAAASPGRSTGPQTYSCFDFHLRSTLNLNELVPAKGRDATRPMVDLRLASLPEKLPGARAADHGLQICDGTVMLTVAGTARYLVRNGCEIVIDPAPGASERNVRLFLLGSALGILCHQRGLLPLHANAIVIGGGAVAFAGASGAGKSTLAAYFLRAGYPVLCDDVCVIGFDPSGRPRAWPGLPRLKLWGDAVKAFGHDHESLDRVIEGQEKYHVPLAADSPAGPAEFRRLYVLSRAEGDDAGTIARLRGQQAMEVVMAQTYRGMWLRPMGLGAQHFRLCAALLAHAQVYVTSRAWGYDVFKREGECLERHALERD